MLAAVKKRSVPTTARKFRKRKTVVSVPLIKVYKIKPSRAEYVQLLAEAERFPLAFRLAAHIWNHGVRLAEFEEKLHIEDNFFSKTVYEHMANFHFGRGRDPDTAPPFRPSFVEVTEELTIKNGRQSEIYADKVLSRFVKKLRCSGWEVCDVQSAMERWIDGVEVPVISLGKVDDSLRELFMEEIETREDEIKKRKGIKLPTCSACSYPLRHELVVSMNPKTWQVTHSHVWCWFLHYSPVAMRVEGMGILDANSGKKMVWTSGAWKEKL